MEYAIDLVYTWCDAADSVWNAKRMATAQACGVKVGAPGNTTCRFAEHDEILYSLRSAECCVPWVRKVFLVIDDDITPPAWLRLDHPKLRIVRLSEIMPSAFLPCFCSGTIEHHLARIPDLSEHFLYSNDDMMFGRPLTPSFFFAADGCPYFRFGGKRKPTPDGMKTVYQRNIERADSLIRSECESPGRELSAALSRNPHHCIDAYRKSDMMECYARHSEVLEQSFAFPFRSPDKVQRIIYAYDAILRGRGHFRLARSGISGNRPWYKRLLKPGYAESLQFVGKGIYSAERAIAKWRPQLLCLNGSDIYTDADYAFLTRLQTRLYPRPSSFELEGMASRKDVC